MTVPQWFLLLAAIFFGLRALFGIAALTDKPATEEEDITACSPRIRTATELPPRDRATSSSVAGSSAANPGGGRDPRRTPVVAADAASPRQPPAGVVDWQTEGWVA